MKMSRWLDVFDYLELGIAAALGALLLIASIAWVVYRLAAENAVLAGAVGAVLVVSLGLAIVRDARRRELSVLTKILLALWGVATVTVIVLDAVS